MPNLSNDLGFIPVTRIETGDEVLGGSELTQPNKSLAALTSRDEKLRQDIDNVNNSLGDLSSFKIIRDRAISVISDGRITPVQGQAAHSQNITGAGTLYYTPYNGRDMISLWDETANDWKLVTFQEKAIDVSSLANYTVFDIYGYLDENGELALENSVWANGASGSSNRGYDVSYLDGALVKTSSKRKLLATCRIGLHGGIDDTFRSRPIDNIYNKVDQTLTISDEIQHRYTGSTYRLWRNNASNRFELCFAEERNPIRIEALGNAGFEADCHIGIGLNSTSQSSALIGSVSSDRLNDNIGITSTFNGTLSAGANVAYLLQFTGNVNSSNPSHATYFRGGMSAIVKM